MNGSPPGYRVGHPKREEIGSFLAAVEAEFDLSLVDSERARLERDFDPGRSLAAYAGDGELVGTLSSNQAEMTLPGGIRTPINVVSDLGVVPAHRGRGLMRLMIETHLAQCIARKEPIVALQSEDPALYARFGFGVAAWQRTLVIDVPAAVVGLLAVSPSAHLSRAVPAATASGLADLFEWTSLRRPGELRRSARWWLEELAARREAERSAQVRLLGEGQAINGAVSSHVLEGLPDGEERVIDLLLARDDRARRELLWHLLCKGEVGRLRIADRPVDERVDLLLADPSSIRTETRTPSLLLRLVDPVHALGLLVAANEGRLCVGVEDRLQAVELGSLMIEGRPGSSISVRPCDDSAELSLGATELAACYLGGTSATAFVGTGRAFEHRVGAAAELDALLTSAVAPHCSTLL